MNLWCFFFGHVIEISDETINTWNGGRIKLSCPRCGCKDIVAELTGKHRKRIYNRDGN